MNRKHQYKQETGKSPVEIWSGHYTDEYVDWLESKLNTPSVKMKVWVVRETAGMVMSRGLQNVYIHFTKPIFVVQKLSDRDRDTAFGFISEKESNYRNHGWIEPDFRGIHRVSVGKWLGYDNPISNYIWSKVKEHFNNVDVHEFEDQEKQGKSKQEDFCLELELGINLIETHG